MLNFQKHYLFIVIFVIRLFKVERCIEEFSTKFRLDLLSRPQTSIRSSNAWKFTWIIADNKINRAFDIIASLCHKIGNFDETLSRTPLDLSRDCIQYSWRVHIQYHLSQLKWKHLNIRISIRKNQTRKLCFSTYSAKFDTPKISSIFTNSSTRLLSLFT